MLAPKAASISLMATALDISAGLLYSLSIATLSFTEPTVSSTSLQMKFNGSG